MALQDTIAYLSSLLGSITEDLSKSSKGNKTAAQRVRVHTVELEKIGKQFRKESMASERKSLQRKKSKPKKKH